MSELFLSLPIAEGISEKRARYLFCVRSEKARDDDEQLAATQSHGVLSQKRYMQITGNKVVAALAGTDNFNHVEQDDFVISLRTFEGGIERATEPGCVSPAYTVLAPSRDVEPTFYQYFLKSQVFISHLQTTVTGIRDGKSVKFENFANIILPNPDLPTQRAIADFLDREIARIDSLIEKKQRLMELLGEREENYIKGLLSGDSIDALGRKTTPAPWLQNVPSHWDVVPLRYLVEVSTGGRDTQDRVDDGEYPFFVRSMTIERINTFSFNEETVLTSGDGAGVGIVFHHIDCKFDLHQRMYAFTNFQNVSGRYFYFFLRTFFKFQMTQWSAKSTVDSVRMPFLKSLLVTVPPVEEQIRIVNEIEVRADRDLQVKKKTTQSIDRLKEYRSALITSAVTGQIDVSTYARSETTDRQLDSIQSEMQA